MYQMIGDRVKQQMDEALKKAEEDFSRLSAEARAIVTCWWREWYLEAGHRRLGRILVSFAIGKEVTFAAGEKSMDKAADQALAIFKKIPVDKAKTVAAWHSAWYKTAGHRRLGRMYVEYCTDERRSDLLDFFKKFS
jgi:hypothetical protein